MKIYKNSKGNIIDVSNLTKIYYSGKPIKEISPIFNCSKAQIEKIIHQEIPIKRKRELKYKINEDYFNKIDTSDKAYILGFILADGSMNKAGNCIKIGLSFKDVEILEYIKTKTGSESPIRKYRYKDKEYCTIEMYSRKICESLKKFGCVPNKTERLNWNINDISDQYLNNFIRGFFDGDGYFGYHMDKDKYIKAGISLTATCQFCEGFVKFFRTLLHINFYTAKRHKNSTSNTTSISVSGNKQVSKFMTWIYKDFGFSLRRKKKRFEEFCLVYDEAKRIRLTKRKISTNINYERTS